MENSPTGNISVIKEQMMEVLKTVSAVCDKLGIEMPATVPSEQQSQLSRAILNSVAQQAKYEYDERRRRAKYFNRRNLGEPAWDILLDLLIHADKERDVSITSACIGAEVPATTGLRWLRILELDGLIEMIPDPNDGRRRLVRLSSEAYSKFIHYFSEKP